MLKNYEIVKNGNTMLITYKKCRCFHNTTIISDNIIDIHNSRQMVEQF